MVDAAAQTGFRAGSHVPPVFLRPERRSAPRGLLAKWLQAVKARIAPRLARSRLRRISRIIRLVAAESRGLTDVSDGALDAMLRGAAHELRRSQKFELVAVARTFAIVREMSGRVLGQRHYDVQILGAFTMLNGMLAEMATGEGKTLTAVLTAGTAALAGWPVHVITVNDYLATRDANHLRPLYERMGLSVGTVVSGQSLPERQSNYACDIVYCTNKELAFDYLRDGIALGENSDNLRLKLERMHRRPSRAASLRLRGLHFAIVDEADSVLVDEARTPLIISAPLDLDVYGQTSPEAIPLAKQMVEGEDYQLLASEHRVLLTHLGQRRVEMLSADLSENWRNPIVREELACQALAAIHLFKRDEHYLLRDGKVALIDEYTGRVMPDRKWSAGLHQMVEAKEKCEVTSNQKTIARITYQKLFRRYQILSGMSGTLAPIARELWSVYDLAIVPIPVHRPLRRIVMPDQVFRTGAEKWDAVIGCVENLHRRGLPVLVGTRSVAASEHLSIQFQARGLSHDILNASQDKNEAGIVARAGQAGQITIATNMAGRGTDIKVAPEAIERGGLQVIMTERHDSRRIDDQLAGRCARQGEPGCFRAFLSLDDALMTDYRAGPFASLRRQTGTGHRRGRAHRILEQQKTIEALHRRMRMDLLKIDSSERQLNAFTGQGE